MNDKLKILIVFLVLSLLLTGCQFLPKKKSDNGSESSTERPTYQPPSAPTISIHFIKTLPDEKYL